MKIQAYLAELIGTFTLVFVGVGAIAADFILGGNSGLVGVALAHGLAIAVMVSATATVSGGHLNPAVTFGLFVVKRIDLPNAVAYVVAQCTGAVLAAGLLWLALPADVLHKIGMGTPAINVEAGVTLPMALITEIVLTFFLAFVVYGTAVAKRAPKMGGLFIGMTVTLDILVGGPISGAAMNPARHLGPALFGGGMQHIWVYWLGPLIGGMLGAVAYRYGMKEE